MLAACGVASRRAVEALIDAGRVKVNGTVVRQQGVTVDPAKDRVHVYEVLAAAGEAEAGEAASGGSGKSQGQGQGKGQGKGGSKAVQGPVEGATGRWRPVPLTAYQDARSKYYFALNKPKVRPRKPVPAAGALRTLRWRSACGCCLRRLGWEARHLVHSWRRHASRVEARRPLLTAPTTPRIDRTGA